VTVAELCVVEIVKSGVGGGLTTNVTVAECVRLPLVPVTVRVYVPAAVEPEVATLIVEEPEPLIEDELKVAEAPDGKPPAVRLTAPVKPPTALTVAV
jgi:hypothetical protein